MTGFRQTLGLRTEEAKATPKANQWRITITGPLKGPKPLSFLIEAKDAKVAMNDARRLFQHGKPTIEAA